MKRWIIRILVIATLAGLGFWGWRVFFPSPEQVIRKRMTELAQAASIAPREGPLAQVANAQHVAAFFTPDIELKVDVPGHPLFQLSGREDLFTAAMHARSMLGGLTVKFPDVVVTVAPDRTSATGNVTVWGKIPSDKDLIVEELKINWQKINGAWLIRQVESVQTLR